MMTMIFIAFYSYMPLEQVKFFPDDAKFLTPAENFEAAADALKTTLLIDNIKWQEPINDGTRFLGEGTTTPLRKTSKITVEILAMEVYTKKDNHNDHDN